MALQQALADLDAAYRNFFASVAGRRKGPKAGRPRFRSRMGRRQAIGFTANARFKVLASGKLRLPKIGDVPVRWSRPPPSEPSEAVQRSGHHWMGSTTWYASGTTGRSVSAGCLRQSAGVLHVHLVRGCVDLRDEGSQGPGGPDNNLSDEAQETVCQLM